jgi:hypothetical protein
MIWNQFYQTGKKKLSIQGDDFFPLFDFHLLSGLKNEVLTKVAGSSFNS